MGWESIRALGSCDGLTLAHHQVTTNATLSLLSSAGHRRENIRKGLRVKMRTQRDHSPITVRLSAQNRLDLKKLIMNLIRVG